MPSWLARLLDSLLGSQFGMSINITPMAPSPTHAKQPAVHHLMQAKSYWCMFVLLNLLNQAIVLVKVASSFVGAGSSKRVPAICYSHGNALSQKYKHLVV
jgi:hypothetical protein